MKAKVMKAGIIGLATGLALLCGCEFPKGEKPAFRLADAVVVTAKCSDKEEQRAMAAAAADLTNVICHVTGRAPAIYEEGDERAARRAAPTGDSQQTLNSPVIYLGATAAAKAAGIDGAGMRNGDGRFKAVPGKAFLYGKTAWGARVALTTFAERSCDHWVVSVDAVDVFTRNPELTVPVADVTVRPAVYSRELYHGMFNGYRNPKTGAAWGRYGNMRLALMPQSIEGRYRLSYNVKDYEGRTSLCHSQYSYIPSQKYFKDHPEYYSTDENGGHSGRDNFGRQLCFTNPDTYRICLESLERFVAADRKEFPNDPPLVYDFTQGDSCNRLCLCPECRKVIAKYNRVPGGHAEGGDAGLQLEFVNRLVRDINKKYPGVRLRTFAYCSSERAPKGGIRPDPNVIIWICDLYSTCDHTQPLTKKGHYNELHARNIREWAALTDNLQIWDYKLPAGWDYALMNGCPEACVDAMQADAKFFAECKVQCYFIEQYPGQPFYDLEYFLNSHFLVDPDCDADALVRTFCRGYGKGADDMYAYIQDLRRESLEHPAKTPTEWHLRTLPWVNRTVFERLAARAEAAYAKESDPRLRPRIARVVSATWKKLLDLYKSDPSAAKELAAAIDKYRRYANEAAETAFMEPARRAEVKEQIKTEIELLTLKFNDLPEELKGVSEKELVCVDYHFQRDGERVADKASERGFAIRAVGFEKMPLACGLYDEVTKDSVGFQVTADANPEDGKYRWNKLGRCHIGRNTIFWFPGSWYSSFLLKDQYIQADGLAVDPNWYEVWASIKRADGKLFIDRLLFRRVAPPKK